MTKHNIFISHISSETEIAQVLKKHIYDSFLGQVDVFVSSDGHSIAAGEKWLDEVDEALLAAKIEIILCSKESVGRPWINFEAGAGWIRKIPVVPFCHSGLLPTELPAPLNMLQALVASNSESIEKLYSLIAKIIGFTVPNTDYKNIAREIKALERQNNDRKSIKKINQPNILCGASKEYSDNSALGFQNDIEMLNDNFPGQVIVEKELTSISIAQKLMMEKFDIVHLVAPVTQIGGDIIFSAIGEKRQKQLRYVKNPNLEKELDHISASDFSSLLLQSEVSLVILATCHSLDLAAQISPPINVIATPIGITSEQFAEWGEKFYAFLSQGMPLSKAMDSTEMLCKIPMRLFQRRDLIIENQPQEKLIN